jgi:PAS domain S-box-containing protein
MLRPLKALIVEDCEDDAVLVLRELRRAGYQPACERVETAAQMRSALARESWDLVICDYVLPSFSAPAALELLKEAAADIPVIVVSGAIGEELAAAIMRQGASDYLTKGYLARLGPAIERELQEAASRHERRLAETALRESEARYRSLVMATAQIVWVAAPNGESLGDPTAWMELTGQTLGETAGLGWLDAIHPEDRSLAQEMWQEALRTGTRFEYECRIRRRDGTYGHFSVRGVPVTGQNGQVREWVGTLTDISVRKRVEDELREASRAKDRFLAILSHELRNPLAAIAGGVDVLQRHLPDDPTARRVLALIRRNVEVQTRLVDDLLDLSRIVLGKVKITPEPVRLDVLVASAAEQFRRRAEESDLALLVTEMPEAWVSGDPARLEQVLVNLLDNAVKFTPSGGSITLSVQVDGELVRMAVADTGKGISSGIAGDLFELFRQGQQRGEAQPGLGIGLAVVKQLVEQHGGTVLVESEGHGKGTRFTVQLRTIPPVRRCDEAPPGREREKLTAIRVLLVDDNVDALQILAELLTMEGCEVLTAASGEEALALLERGTRPEVIVSDLALPGIDGRELLTRVRRIAGLEQVPALALSGFGEEEDAHTSLQAGFLDHLVKPFDVDELIRRIREAIRPGAGTAA